MLMSWAGYVEVMDDSHMHLVNVVVDHISDDIRLYLFIMHVYDTYEMLLDDCSSSYVWK